MGSRIDSQPNLFFLSNKNSEDATKASYNIITITYSINATNITGMVENVQK